MLLFDDNGIGRIHEAIRGPFEMADRPVTCEQPEHPVQVEFSGWNSGANLKILSVFLRMEQLKEPRMEYGSNTDSPSVRNIRV
jgi:hypothetical protein